MRADLGGYRSALADRSTDDHEIGVLDGLRIRFRHRVGKLERGNAPARCRGTGGGHDRARGAAGAHGAGDRGADETDSDQRQPLEESRVAHDAKSMNCASASTTKRLASSLPTVSRSAPGKW